MSQVLENNNNNGLQLDSVFIRALQQDATLMAAIGSRLYGTAIPLPDEDVDNVPVPYVIVTFDGLTNEGLTKDDSFEGMQDAVTIGVTVVAGTLEALHGLTSQVRDVLSAYMAGYEGTDGPVDYQFSAGRIEYDSQKPCYWQGLTYQCSVYR